MIREFPNPVYYTRENSSAYRLPHSHDPKPGNEGGEAYIALMITEGIIIVGKQLRLRIKRQIEINPRTVHGNIWRVYFCINLFAWSADRGLLKLLPYIHGMFGIA